jgi:DNA-binding MarR family transcriptional regulator
VIPAPSTSTLLREVVRQFVRMQRVQASCGDGTSTVQCHVLNELLRHEGLTQQNLVQRLGLDKGWISRAVDGLVESGAVLRQTDPADRRCVRLTLTKAGRERATALDKTLNDHAGQVLAAIAQDQHPAIRESLQSLLAALLDQATQKACLPSACSGAGGALSAKPDASLLLARAS